MSKKKSSKIEAGPIPKNRQVKKKKKNLKTCCVSNQDQYYPENVECNYQKETKMIQQSARWLAQGNEESQVSKGAAQILDLEPKKKLTFN